VDHVVTRRWLRVVAALALVAGACSNSKGGSTVGSTLPTPSSTDATNAGGATTTSNGASASTQKSGGATSKTTTKANAGGGDAIHDTSLAGPGAMAGIILAPGPATSIVLDVLVQSGVSADQGVLSTLREILGATSGKPVTLRGPTALTTSGNVHDGDSIRHLADSQGKAQGNGAAVIHLIYLQGSYSDNSVLGVTVRADTTAIFPQQIADSSSPLVSRQRLEQAVATHELGHVMGLVDLYLLDGRDDQEHPGHSTNPHSVMYWAVETDLVGQVLDGPPPVAFDAADQNDLSRIHGGASAAR
jgi:hypothetical protein